MTTYSINSVNCTKCNKCIVACPAGLAIETNGDYKINQNYCIKCGHCACVCPHNAAICNEIVLPQVKQYDYNSDEIKTLISGKRSVRNYTEEIISQEILEEIIQIGVGSPTASNSRNLKFVLLQQNEVELASVAVAKEMLKLISLLKNKITGPIIRLQLPKFYSNTNYVSNFKEKMTKVIEGKQDRIFFKAPAVVVVLHPEKDKNWGRTNSALAGQNMMLYAKSLKIESCIIGFADKLSDKKLIAQALKVPENYKVGLIFTLGKSKEVYYKIPKR